MTRRQGSAGDASDAEKFLRVDAVIAGSVEESNATGPGSADSTLGTDRKVAPAVNRCHASTTAMDHCHTNTRVDSAYTHAGLICGRVLIVFVCSVNTQKNRIV